MISTNLFVTFAILFVPVAVMQIFMPMLTRRTESFGVSIPSDQYQNPDIVQLRKKYVLWTVVLSVLALVIMIFASAWPLALPILLVVYMVVSFFIYLRFHNLMKALKAEQNWHAAKKQKVVVDTTFRSKKLRYSNVWFVIGFLLTIATITVSLAMYDHIPARFPLKYDFAGHVTKWGNKSYRVLFLLPVMQVYLTGLFMFINSMIGRTKANIDPDAPAESIEKNVIFRLRWSAFSILAGTAVVLIMALEQMSFIFDIDPVILNTVNIMLITFIVVSALVLSFLTGQGGSRVRKKSEQDPKFVNRDDDRYWKLGVFYFNPQDPSLFVEKRFGIGWTINNGNPKAWLFLVGIVAIIILIPVVFNG